MSVTKAGLLEALHTTSRSMRLNVAVAKGGRSRHYTADEEGGQNQPNKRIDRHVNSPLRSTLPLLYTAAGTSSGTMLIKDRSKRYRGSQSEVSGEARIQSPSTARGVSGVQLAIHAFEFTTDKKGLGVLGHVVKGDMRHRLLLWELCMLLSTGFCYQSKLINSNFSNSN